MPSLLERLAAIAPDMIVVDADSQARDTIEHVVRATCEAGLPIVAFTDNGDATLTRAAIAIARESRPWPMSGAVFDTPRGPMRQRTQAALELVGMGHASAKCRHEISGSVKQVGIAARAGDGTEGAAARRALGRARRADPRAPAVRAELLGIGARTHASKHSTTIKATHGVDEAVQRSERIVRMNNGSAAAIGEVLTVDLPRPRDRIEFAGDARYVHCRKCVLDVLHTRHRCVELHAAQATGPRPRGVPLRHAAGAGA